MLDFEKLEAIAKDLMKKRQVHLQRETGSVYDHGLRVSKAVLRLRELALPGDASMDENLRAAGLFHDLGKGIEPHGHYGAVLMRDILKGMADEKQTEIICRMIEVHDDRCKGGGKHDKYTGVLQDADLIDHFGTYDIWMVFNDAAYLKEGIGWAAERFDNLENYYNIHLPLLNYPVSVEIAKEKRAFEREFVKRLQWESKGEYAKPWSL